MIVRLVLACVMLAIALGMLRMREYRRWFRLPTRRTDALPGALAGAVIPLHLERDGFVVPAGPSLLGRTVLLELRVRAALLGRLFDPFIELACGDVRQRQYFERGASGQRLLDLSPCFQSTATPTNARLRLAGGRLRWQREATLHVFEPPVLAERNVMIVAPHPDDAEIAAFGIYATHRSWVVTITAGERGGGVPVIDVPKEDGLQWAALLRVSDSLSVPQLGRVTAERCVNLVYPDGALERMHREPSLAFQLACEPGLPRAQLRSMNTQPGFRDCPPCTWNHLVAELRQLLELAQPDVIVCPHPLLDKNDDHIYSTRAVALALRASPKTAPLVLLYAVHHAGAPVHPHGPATAVSGVPPHDGASWLADSLYSHLLAPRLRVAKLLAVENMHGVRTNRLPAVAQIRGWLAGLGTDPTSFLRRAPRPTEMYYVLSPGRLSELVGAG